MNRMGTLFWIRRFVFVLCLSFAVIAPGLMARDRPCASALFQASIWAPIAATIFVATRLFHSSRGRRCNLCRDMPGE